jgi:4-amino-4-deoxychorismate lyase
MMLVNGHQQTQIEISDRGLQYGDGVFETIEILNGHLVFLEPHLQRLAQGCQRLLLPALDVNLITQEALTLSKSCSQGVLKIIITRGSGGRGYRQPETINPTRIISLHPYPNYPKAFQTGVQVRFCQQQLALNPTLAGLKHLNRLEQILARAEWNDPTIQEGIMLDYHHHVIEGTMSNLFFVSQDKLYTPSLVQSGIAGIMRDFILKTAQKIGIDTIIGSFIPEDLLNADALFITNSIIGIWPIKSLEKHAFESSFVTQSLQHHLRQYKLQFL